MKEYWKIKTSFPIVIPADYLLNGWYEDQWYIMLDVKEIFKISEDFKKVHDLLIKSDPIARIWNYKWVYKLYTWVEWYTPDNWSNPWPWIIWVEELMKIIIFETYFDLEKVSKEQLNNFLKDLLDIHPWETPVIEVIEKWKTYLYTL